MITVVGAGPSGLALAYYLQRRELPFQLLEKDEVAASWARYYDHLRLHTRKANVALPGLALPGAADSFPTGTQYLAYLRAYAQHFAFPVRTGTELEHAQYLGGWQLTTNQGVMKTDRLVIATGIYGTPRRPELPGQAQFLGDIRHAHSYRCPAPYRHERVLVVGAGNTGVGIALDLVAAGLEVGLVIRDGVQLAPLPRTAFGTRLRARFLEVLPGTLANLLLSHLRRDDSGAGLPRPSKPPLEVTPVIGLEILEALKRGRLEPHPAIAHVNERSVTFVDGRERAYDALILATGYRPSLDTLAGDLRLGDNGHFVAPPPGLHALGFYYPTTEPFLLAVKRAAAKLAERLEREVQTGE